MIVLFVMYVLVMMTQREMKLFYATCVTQLPTKLVMVAISKIDYHVLINPGTVTDVLNWFRIKTNDASILNANFVLT